MRDTTHPVRVSMTNTCRHNDSQSALFTPGSLFETPLASDIYLITEPWWHIGDQPDEPHYSVKEPAGLYPILPAQVVPPELRPRVFAYASSTRHDFEVFNRYDLAQDLDFLILEIRQGRNPAFLLILLYNQDAPEDGQRVGRTFQRFMQLDLPDMPIAIAMDANEHHHMWDSFTAATSRGGEEMLAWMEEHGFSVLNNPDVATWRKDDHSQSSVLDLVWQNEEMAALGLLQDFAVSESVHDFSDHHTVSWVFNYGWDEVDTGAGVSYNFKHADATEFKAEFCSRLNQHAAVFAELRDAPKRVRNTDLLERAAAAMHDALNGATEAKVPKRKPS